MRVSGEISTKASATRHQFANRLAANLADAVGAEGSVDRRYDRLFVRAPDMAGLEAAARVFGVQSLAPARVVPADSLESVVAAATEQFSKAVVGRRFAVRAKVVGDRRRRTMRAKDIEIALGRELLERSAGVDLGNPEVVAGVEVYQGNAYLFAEELRGPAGLPLGAESRAVALVSGASTRPWQPGSCSAAASRWTSCSATSAAPPTATAPRA